MNRLILALINLILVLDRVSAQEILGCSGYVKSDFEIDFAKINVGLYTEHGSHRGSTDCAPNSGFFFLPVDQHGNYVLKVMPPPGWTITPSEVQLSVDGSTDPCSRKEDILFKFAGFSIHGKVSSKDTEAGPSGLTLTLKSKGSPNIEAKASSDSEGNFEFSGVKAGKYVVGLGEDSLESFSFEKREYEVSVVDSGVTVPTFVIIGYDVEGRVVDKKNIPFHGAQLILYQDGTELQRTQSDSSGQYRFANVSKGSYIVKSQSIPDKVVIEPDTWPANVVDKNVQINNFVAKDFGIKGKVLYSKNGKGVAGAQVTVKQEAFVKTAVTDSNGNYVVVAENQGDVEVSCAKDGVAFDDFVGTVKPELPPLYPSKYAVSGNAEVSDEAIKVTFKDKNGKKISESVKQDGSFQSFLPPGQYEASVEIVNGPGSLHYMPQTLKVEVKDSPVTGVTFSLAKFKISGSVVCQGQCGKIRLDLKGANEAMTVTSNEKGQFAFDNVRQGKYVVTIDKANRCWRENKIDVNVKRDVTDLKFEQSGHEVEITSDHETKLKLGTNALDVVKGSQKICLQGSGSLSVTTEGCFGFQSTPESLVLGKDASLLLTTVSYKVSGLISTSASIPDLKILASSEERGEEDIKTTKTNKGYSFGLNAVLNEVIEIAPSSKNTFFNPKSLVVTVLDSCKKNFVEFSAKEGVFIQGSLSPPVEGALVEILDEETKATLSAKSEVDGSFKVGPFVSVSKQKITVSKEGYFFEETNDYGKFKSKKLSSVTVNVKDEEGKPLLEDVVISISGGAGYRNTAHTKDGVALFPSLHPGEYYIKAFLKEYQFEPKNIVAKVGESKNEVKVLTAKRVAFSAYGEVVFLNGNKAPGVVILGRGQGKGCEDRLEDAVTQSDGTFRLRGLEPQCNYLLESGSKDIQTLLTKTKMIDASKARDIQINDRIIAHARVDVFHVAVKVKMGSQSQRKSVTVKVVPENETGTAKVLDVIPNQLTYFPTPLPIIDTDYLVKVDGKVVNRIAKNNDQFRFVSINLQEAAKSSKRSGNDRLMLLVPLTLIIVVVVVMRRVYQQKEK